MEWLCWIAVFCGDKNCDLEQGVLQMRENFELGDTVLVPAEGIHHFLYPRQSK